MKERQVVYRKLIEANVFRTADVRHLSELDGSTVSRTAVWAIRGTDYTFEYHMGWPGMVTKYTVRKNGTEVFSTAQARHLHLKVMKLIKARGK